MNVRRTSIAASLVVLLAACSEQPRLTGLGATRSVWNAHHGPEYSAVSTDASGRVLGYILTTKPRSLAQAEAQVKQDLPADATASTPQLTVGIEQTKCELVQFTSATLQHTFGGAHGGEVLAEFEADESNLMNTDHIVTTAVISGDASRDHQC